MHAFLAASAGNGKVRWTRRGRWLGALLHSAILRQLGRCARLHTPQHAVELAAAAASLLLWYLQCTIASCRLPPLLAHAPVLAPMVLET